MAEDRRCDDVLDYIWRQEMLLRDKTSKIEKLQQLPSAVASTAVVLTVNV